MPFSKKNFLKTLSEEKAKKCRVKSEVLRKKYMIFRKNSKNLKNLRQNRSARLLKNWNSKNSSIRSLTHQELPFRTRRPLTQRRQHFLNTTTRITHLTILKRTSQTTT